MEISKKEIELAEQVARNAEDEAISQLAALELCVVGGGCGVDIFY